MDSFSPVDVAFSKVEYLPFLRYCKNSSILFIEQITPVDYVAYRSMTGSSSDDVKEIKRYIAEFVSKRAEEKMLDSEFLGKDLPEIALVTPND